jgi:hypothetical protein
MGQSAWTVNRTEAEEMRFLRAAAAYEPADCKKITWRYLVPT